MGGSSIRQIGIGVIIGGAICIVASVLFHIGSAFLAGWLPIAVGVILVLIGRPQSEP